MQVYNQDNVVQSVLSSAVSTVIGSQGGLLGAGELEVSPLLSGGVHIIDTWVELEVGSSRVQYLSVSVLGEVYRRFV